MPEMPQEEQRVEQTPHSSVYPFPPAWGGAHSLTSHCCRPCPLPLSFLRTWPRLWTLPFSGLLSSRSLGPTSPMAGATREQLLLGSRSVRLCGSLATATCPSPPLLSCLPGRKGPVSSSLATVMNQFIFEAGGSQRTLGIAGDLDGAREGNDNAPGRLEVELSHRAPADTTEGGVEGVVKPRRLREEV